MVGVFRGKSQLNSDKKKNKIEALDSQPGLPLD